MCQGFSLWTDEYHILLFSGRFSIFFVGLVFFIYYINRHRDRCFSIFRSFIVINLRVFWRAFIATVSYILLPLFNGGCLFTLFRAIRAFGANMYSIFNLALFSCLASTVLCISRGFFYSLLMIKIYIRGFFSDRLFCDFFVREESSFLSNISLQSHPIFFKIYNSCLLFLQTVSGFLPRITPCKSAE